MNIILASTSPRRRELLDQIGLDYKVVSPDVDETVGDNMAPWAVVEELSLRKARAAAAHCAPGDLVIAADTVVALEGTVLGKPHDGRDAFQMLSALSGNRHQVYTGVTIIRGEQVLTEHEMTTVTFRETDPAEIEDYIATGEPMDKAGAYGIQGMGALFIQGIDGDYHNVMGLPLYRLGRMLARLGVDPIARAAGR